MTPKAPLILFAEDELTLAEIVKENLEARGFSVLHFADGSGLLESFYAQKPAIIVLDVMLPDTDGFAIARQIRESDSRIPILFLTSRSLPQDVVAGFESGGNDYLKKPFSIEELSVRIKALIKHNEFLPLKVSSNNIVAVGNYRFDHQQQKLYSGPELINLTARENEILKLLVLNKNQVVERRVILIHVWQNEDFFTGRSLDVFITRLRKFFANDPTVQISNLRGVGYKLIC